MRTRRAGIVTTLLVSPTLLAATVTQARPDADGPRIAYSISYDAGAEPAEWRVSLDASGLSGEPDVALVLSDFGSWTDLGDYYLTRLNSSPPSRPDPARADRFIVEIPPGWDGSLHAEYALHAARTGSKAQQAHALLPARSSRYTYGCTSNTLMAVEVGGQPVSGREVRITPPPGWAVFSGWAGHTDGPQRFEMEAHDRNGLLAMGVFTDRARAEAGGVPIEVCQFGEAPRAAAKVAAWLAALTPLAGRTTGRAPGPVRVFLSDSCGGGMMTDRGLVVGIREGWGDAELDAPSTRHTVAHEFYHTWLGGAVRPQEDLTWFQEGFTDYLSLWHAAAAGIVPPEWMVRRLLEFDEAARSSSMGHVAFADPTVAWRDGDGPNERMAYCGGHVVAFALDCELRARGRPDGVQALIRDLVRTGPTRCTRDDLKRWFDANGAADLWETYIAGKTIPDTAAFLRREGCVQGSVPERLTYLGVRAEPADPAEPLRNLAIVELDPAGPAALAGARVGDVITGWYPTRGPGVNVGPGVTTPYAFGLTRFDPDADGAYFGVRRADGEAKIDFTPRVIEGGERPTLRPGPGFAAFLNRPE